MRNLYSGRANLVVGFHGCDRQVALRVVNGETPLIASRNDYDWLGSGIYFWENNLERALQWAEASAQQSGSKIREPFAVGAVIDLGYCLDLLDSACIREVKKAYDVLRQSLAESHLSMPRNYAPKGSEEVLMRKLDCAVIQTAHQHSAVEFGRQYDSVRAMFQEGAPLYEGVGFMDRNHIQLCVCNPNCILGYFLPQQVDEQFPLP